MSSLAPSLLMMIIIAPTTRIVSTNKRFCMTINYCRCCRFCWSIRRVIVQILFHGQYWEPFDTDKQKNIINSHIQRMGLVAFCADLCIDKSSITTYSIKQKNCTMGQEKSEIGWVRPRATINNTGQTKYPMDRQPEKWCWVLAFMTPVIAISRDGYEGVGEPNSVVNARHREYLIYLHQVGSLLGLVNKFGGTPTNSEGDCD